MKVNYEKLVSNGAIEMDVTENKKAFVMPVNNTFSKMLMYLKNKKVVWCHKDYKKENKKRKKEVD